MEATTAAVRRLTLEKQGLTRRPKKAGVEELYSAFERLGCVQIDSINVVKRAHHVALYNRVGPHSEDLLNRLAYRDRRVFEGWGHAMCYMPTKDWRFLIAANRSRAEQYVVHEGWWGSADHGLVEGVYERIRREGPLGSRDFDGQKSGSGWWGWKPAKMALEVLFSAGRVMVERRDGFQRIFDLTERVLPAWAETREPAEEERARFFTLRTLGCLGAVRPPEVRGYYHPWCVKLNRTTRQLGAGLEALAGEGEAERVEIGKRTYYCLPRDADRLAELDGDAPFHDVRFLTNFDSLLWQKDRVSDLFGFERKLEIYLRPEQRQYGYYSMPVLYGDRIVGRVDPKLDRKTRRLIIRGTWYEEGFEPDAEFREKFSAELESFAAFCGADGIDTTA